MKTDLGGEKSAIGVAPTAGGRPAAAPRDEASPGGAATADPHLAEILGIADDAIIAVNSAQAITMFNRGAERVFGYKLEEAPGRPLAILLPDRSGNNHRGLIQGFAVAPDAARVMAERREISGRRKDGSEFPAEASIARLEGQSPALRPGHEGLCAAWPLCLRQRRQERKAQAHASCRSCS